MAFLTIFSKIKKPSKLAKVTTSLKKIIEIRSGNDEIYWKRTDERMDGTTEFLHTFLTIFDFSAQKRGERVFCKLPVKCTYLPGKKSGINQKWAGFSTKVDQKWTVYVPDEHRVWFTGNGTEMEYLLMYTLTSLF